MPTANEIRAARGCRVPDVIVPGLKVLFCGANPGLYSAAAKCHFARPATDSGQRCIWPASPRGYWRRKKASNFSDRDMGSPVWCPGDRDSSRDSAIGAGGGQTQAGPHCAYLLSLDRDIWRWRLWHSFCSFERTARSTRCAGEQQSMAASQSQRRKWELSSRKTCP